MFGSGQSNWRQFKEFWTSHALEGSKTWGTKDPDARPCATENQALKQKISGVVQDLQSTSDEKARTKQRCEIQNISRSEQSQAGKLTFQQELDQRLIEIRKKPVSDSSEQSPVSRYHTDHLVIQHEEYQALKTLKEGYQKYKTDSPEDIACKEYILGQFVYNRAVGEESFYDLIEGDRDFIAAYLQKIPRRNLLVSFEKPRELEKSEECYKAYYDLLEPRKDFHLVLKELINRPKAFIPTESLQAYMIREYLRQDIDPGKNASLWHHALEEKQFCSVFTGEESAYELLKEKHLSFLENQAIEFYNEGLINDNQLIELKGDKGVKCVLEARRQELLKEDRWEKIFGIVNSVYMNEHISDDDMRGYFLTPILQDEALGNKNPDLTSVLALAMQGCGQKTVKDGNYSETTDVTSRDQEKFFLELFKQNPEIIDTLLEMESQESYFIEEDEELRRQRISFGNGENKISPPSNKESKLQSFIDYFELGIIVEWACFSDDRELQRLADKMIAAIPEEVLFGTIKDWLNKWDCVAGPQKDKWKLFAEKLMEHAGIEKDEIDKIKLR